MKKNAKDKILTVIGIILCIILVPILVVNCTLLFKGFTNENEVPTVGGYAPMIVLTDSMNGTFDGGDLIFIKTIEPEEVKVNDVIAFFDPEGNGTSVVSHRVLAIENEDGTLFFTTKGDANNAEDRLPVSEDKLIGKYTDFYIPNAGNVAMFMQSTSGLILCVVVPIILLVGYDALRRAKYNKKHDEDKDKLLAELEELRKLKEEKANTEA